MSRLLIIDPIEDTRWDRFVEKHPFGQIYHLSLWKKILENSFEHIKGRFLVLFDDAGAKIEAGLPVYEVKSRLTGTRLVSAPYATLFDPLVSNPDQLEVFLKEIIRLATGMRSSYAEIRSLHAYRYFENKQFGMSEFFKHHYLDIGMPLEKVRSGFHRTAVKQSISKAEKSDIRIKFAEDESDLMDFYRLLVRARKKISLFAQPYVFIRSIWMELHQTQRVKLLLAQKSGLTIAAMLLFLFKDRVSVEYSLSDASFLKYCPNHLLYWEGIKLSSERGYKIFDFGRTSPHHNKLLDFKRRWGTQEVDLRHFFYPASFAQSVDQKEDHFKYKMIKRIAGLNLPPLIRSNLGAFIYRHLG